MKTCYIIIGLFLSVSACDVPVTDSLSPTISLRTPVSEPIPPAVGAWPLHSHGDYDRLEGDLEKTGRRNYILLLYKDLHHQRPDDVLLHVRLLSYRLRHGGESAWDDIGAEIDLLWERHPDAADIRFLKGLMVSANMNSRHVLGLPTYDDPFKGSFAFVEQPGPGETKNLQAFDDSIMKLLLHSWGMLTYLHQDYVGPWGVTSDELRLRVGAIMSTRQRQLVTTEVKGHGPVSEGEIAFWKHAIQFHMALRGGDKSGACQHGEEAFEALKLGQDTAATLDKLQLDSVRRWGFDVKLHSASKDIEVFRGFAAKICDW